MTENINSRQLTVELEASDVIDSIYKETSSGYISVTALKVEGTLADLIRNHVDASSVAPVTITTIIEGKYNDENGEENENGPDEHALRVECGEESVEFSSNSYYTNIASLYGWLDIA